MHPKDEEGKAAEKSRCQQIEDDGGTPALPEVTAVYLFDYWQDLGMCSYGGMGPTPISSAEVLAWQQGSGIELLPWEFRALRRASRAYVSESNAESEHPPDGSADTLADPDVIDEKLSRMFDRLARPLEKR